MCPRKTGPFDTCISTQDVDTYADWLTMAFLRRGTTRNVVGLVSPVTGKDDVVQTGVIDPDDLIGRWREWADIDMTAALADAPELHLVRCETTGFEFVAPAWSLFPSELHDRLERIERSLYEMRWDHQWAIRDLHACNRVMVLDSAMSPLIPGLREVGKWPIGIDRSAPLVREAQRLGRPIERRTPTEAAEVYRGRFDAVCIFDSFEREPDIAGLFTAALALLRPRGHLIISVPYTEPDIHRVHDLLLLPPIAVNRFTDDALRALSSSQPVELESLAVGDLGADDRRLYRARFKNQYRVAEELRKEFPDVSGKHLNRLGARRFGSAQRLYARYRKTD